MIMTGGEKKHMEQNVIYGDKVKVYYSDIVGNSILDAVTGAKYPWKVGSKHENKFFKVRSTTSYANSRAKMSEDWMSASSTNQAFYTSPEQYMSHHYVKLPLEQVQEWHNRVNQLNQEAVH